MRSSKKAPSESAPGHDAGLPRPVHEGPVVEAVAVGQAAGSPYTQSYVQHVTLHQAVAVGQAAGSPYTQSYVQHVTLHQAVAVGQAAGSPYTHNHTSSTLHCIKQWQWDRPQAVHTHTIIRPARYTASSRRLLKKLGTAQVVKNFTTIY